MLFSVCVVLLVTMWQASSQAPGDEDQRCLNERAFANDVYLHLYLEISFLSLCCLERVLGLLEQLLVFMVGIL